MLFCAQATGLLRLVLALALVLVLVLVLVLETAETGSVMLT